MSSSLSQQGNSFSTGSSSLKGNGGAGGGTKSTPCIADELSFKTFSQSIVIVSLTLVSKFKTT